MRIIESKELKKMAKRDKRIQKKKKRRERIRRSKARKRSLDEVRDDADFANQPPDELEGNIFELLANESSTWVDEPEFSDVFFDPGIAMLAFIAGMEEHGIDADSFFDRIDEEQRTELMWEVIGEITPMLVTDKHVAQIVTALNRLERRWAADKRKLPHVGGIVLVRTMLDEFAADSENAEALAMIGLMQTLTHRSVMLGFEMDDPFAEANELIEKGDKALFTREIELGLYTTEEVEAATEHFIAMQELDGEEMQPNMLALMEIVRTATHKPNRSTVMSAKISDYVEANQETLPEEYTSVLRTMMYFLDADVADSFDEIERLLVAAMFGEVGRYIEENDLITFVEEEE